MSILSIIALSSRYNLDVYRMISQISCCLIGSDEKFSYYQSTIIWIRAFRYSGGEGAMFLPEHDLFLQLKNKIIFFTWKIGIFFKCYQIVFVENCSQIIIFFASFMSRYSMKFKMITLCICFWYIHIMIRKTCLERATLSSPLLILLARL